MKERMKHANKSGKAIMEDRDAESEYSVNI
jgi:hypothetical protein